MSKFNNSPIPMGGGKITDIHTKGLTTKKVLSEEASVKLSIANVIFTLLIVMMHVSYSFDVPPEILHITQISVPCFFAISAFLYFLSFDFSMPWRSYKSKAIKRFYSLGIPFIVFGLVGAICSYSYFLINPGEHMPHEGLSLSALPEALYFSDFNCPLWYLRALLEMILIMPIFGMAAKLSRYSIFLLIPLYVIGEHSSYFTIPFWFPMTFFGAYIAIYFKELSSIYRSIPTMAKLLLATISLIIIAASDGYLLRAFSPICLTMIFSSIPIWSIKWIIILAPYTLMIYCLHTPISRIAYRIPYALGMHSNILSYVIAVGLTIIMIVVLCKITKMKPELWRFLNGGRAK